MPTHTIRTGLVIACEHASRSLPESVDLGLTEEVMRSHVSWDPGALEIARDLHVALQAPLHAGSYSRLLVDLNRRSEHPQVIPTHLFGVDIPANAQLTPQEREERLARYHRPFRSALRQSTVSYLANGTRSIHLAIHSFTPVLDGQARPFEVGVMYDASRYLDVAVAECFLTGLAAAGYTVRRDEPYRGVGPGNTTWLREQFAEDEYAGVTLEVSHKVSTNPEKRGVLSEQLVRLARELGDIPIFRAGCSNM